MESGYSFVPVISNYNDYKVEDYEESLFTALISLVTTPKGTHPYDPDYGTSIRSFVLETDFGQVSSFIEEDIKAALAKYLPGLYPYVEVVVTRELHPSGFGYKYKTNIVMSNAVITFAVTKQGSLVYKGGRTI